MRAPARLFAVLLLGCSSSSSDSGAQLSDGGATTDGAPGLDSGWPDGGVDAEKDGASGDSGGDADSACATGRGFPAGAPWVSFYGGATGLDLGKVASTFRVINLDADPNVGNVTDPDIATLRGGACNRVISYMNVGACESFRSYYQTAPAGHASCVSSGALTTNYGGYPDEKWANLSNAAYRDLIVNYVAPRLAARGVDGFFLDNLEVVEHGAGASEGPCDAACAQGGLDLVWELRQKFPDKLIVMQNATSDITRLGTTHGAAFPSLLDGVSHEEVYTGNGAADTGSRTEMLAWVAMKMTVGGRPFWLADEEYVGACSAANKATATSIMAKATADGLSPYVTDASAQQSAPCFWSDFP